MDTIQFKDVWEIYRIKFVVGGKTFWENFWALKGINFTVSPKETLGIIGENGAGKTTILKLIAGLIRSDRGEVRVSGRVSGLLDMGAGFQVELTGRENVYLNLSLFGVDPGRLEEICEKIIVFADIGRFMDAPVKCYSQGMFVRLAFSIAIHIEPEILLIDDILAVGDEFFQRKCVKRIFEIKEAGTTIICVTHDMNMLRRLCQRVILVKDGRIIKDDLAEKVIPLYTQMIGAKETVAVLTRGPLTVVFNNGRLSFNWNDKLITPNAGVYSSFVIEGKNYASNQADWEVAMDGEFKLVARGRLYQLAFTQVWRLEITDHGELKWDVEVVTGEPMDLQEGCINVLLENEYTHWFSSFESGEFPDIDEDCKRWRPLIEENAFHKCIGVRTADLAGSGLPLVAFEHANGSHRVRAQVSNSDYIANVRVLQYKLFGMPEKNVLAGDHSLWFSGKVIFNIDNLEKYLSDLQGICALLLEKVKVILSNGQGNIFYEGKGLSGSNHFYSAITVGRRRYLSTSAEPVLEKAQDKIIIRLTWAGLPLVLVWEICRQSVSSFRLKVWMQVNEEVCVDRQELNFVFSKEYISWFNDGVLQDFPLQFSGSDVDVAQKCIQSSDIGFVSRDDIPVVMMRMLNGDDTFVKIFNGDFLARSREIRIYKIGSEVQSILLPGDYPCFEAEVAFLKDRPVTNRKMLGRIHQGALECVLDRGEGRIYWKGRELTKNLGFYAALRCQGRWFNSASSASWQIEVVDDRSIKARSDWLNLPVSQYWELKISELNCIELFGWMTVAEEIEIDRFQMNMMVSEKYDTWSVNGNGGIFPSFKPNIDDDWDVIYSGTGEECITISASVAGAEPLPVLTAMGCGESVTNVLNVVNSDLYHRGRVLQYLKKGPEVFRVNEKYYFKGKIFFQG